MIEDAKLPAGSRIGGYVRVSSEKQVERGESLAAQEQRLRDEAKARRWGLKLYIEPGISAKDEDRPRYQELRQALAEDKLDGVMVFKLDRLWRSKLARQLDEVEFITQTCRKHLGWR
jgi:DNA invertase Pin-like site-specific DNA recombinase